MYTIATNQLFNIYYKSNNLTDLQMTSVIFNVWDWSGTQLITNEQAQYELVNPDTNASHGIYYISTISPATDTYLLCTTGAPDDVTGTTIRCGEPNAQVFYYDVQKRVGLTLNYEIYDLGGSIQQSGILSEYFYGFYGVDISSLNGTADNPVTYFFKLLEETTKFQIPIADNSAVIADGRPRGSKARYSTFDYEGQTRNNNKKIVAKLKAKEEDMKGIYVSLKKEKDEEKQIKALLKTSKGNI